MKVLAHRGDHTKFPGNTLAAFQSALDAGAYGIECDVRLTSDKVPIVFHNFTLLGTTGEGIVSEQPLANIQRLKFNDENGNPASHTIPTLDEVFSTFAGQFYLEVHILPYAPDTIPIMTEYLQSVSQFWHMMEVTSFEPAILLGIQQHCPGLATDLLSPRAEEWMTPEIVSMLAVEKGHLANARAVHIHPSQLTPETVEFVRSQRLDIHAWDVNSPETADHLISLGIDQFTTDNIYLFLSDTR